MILTQEQFVTALASTASAIQLLDSERNKIRDLSKAEVVACMATGNYRAVGRGLHRVRYLQALSKDVMIPSVRAPREPEDDSHYWDDRHLWTWTARDFGSSRGIPLGIDGLPA